MLDRVSSHCHRNIIILGDLNAGDRTRDGAKLTNVLEINHLTSHINEATRITPTSQTTLDRILSNMPYYMKDARVLDPLHHNDHCHTPARG